jgi:hypothetical protein
MPPKVCVCVCVCVCVSVSVFVCVRVEHTCRARRHCEWDQVGNGVIKMPDAS